MAALAAAGTIGIASQAEAALYYGSDSDPGFSRLAPGFSPQRKKSKRHQARKIEAPEKESAKPQGPLIIAISIEKQKMRVYDANGLFAETPISTGMPGHPTPMGVFSVIQKQKLHHSNIYSNAPMPYMQRITWSGIAIHAGVLPGHPASHGCIRMPMAFAVKMWGWTRMGARVVVTPGEISPESFSHPLLVAQKVAPQPVAAVEPQHDAPVAAKSDKADAMAKPMISEASLELRSTVGHDSRVKSDAIEDAAATISGERTRTADASAPNNAPVTVSDAGTSAPNVESAAPHGDAATSTNGAPSVDPVKASDTTAEIKSAETGAADKPEAVKPEESASQNIKDAGVAPDLKKDQTSLQDTDKATASKPAAAAVAAPKHAGQIAVFVSRKDSKLYVRQNFTPLFETPVTIAPSDRPLGTHVFTVQADKDDANILHWSVVSLPASRVNAERRDEDERASRRRKMTGAVETKPIPLPDSAAEALDRLAIPADAMARIADALSTGGSIIVSDQGINSGETGEGTDFIVSLH